jgi:hypothetical protein
MPIEYVTDPRTGKVVPKGALGFGQPVAPERPPAPRAKPKPKAKPTPWWGVGPGGFSLNKLANDLRYEARQLVTDPLKSVERASRATMRGTVPGIAFSQGTVGATQATANAVRAGIEWKQRAQGRKQTDYTTSPAGRAVDRVVDHVYRSAGETPPSEMTADQKGADDMRSALVLGVAGGMGLQLGLKALSGVRFVGPAAQTLANAMDPTRAQTISGGLARIAFDAAASEAVTSPLDYTATGGSAAGLVDMVLGTKIDPVKPGMAFPDAAAAAFIPNVAFGSGLGAMFMGINRARRGQRVVQQTAVQPRAELETAGLTQADPDTGAAAFTEEALTGTSLREANAALEEKYGIKTPEPAQEPAPAPEIPSQAMEPGGAVTDGELPTADPGLDPWAIEYDPELPEADVALSQIKNASDAELLDAVRSGGPVLNTLDEQMAMRQPLEPDPALSTELNTAPTDRLAAPITPFAQQWQRIGQKDPQQLLNVLHPEVNPALADKAQAMFGKQWEELTPADAVDTLQAAANEGATVIPNRLLPGQQIVPTGDLKIDPGRFQYKGGTDARGVQRGSSLEGVDRWNTDMEGVVEVWQDPADGNYYVVNGHNRFAKAKELGIPTLAVKELIADSPEQAKTAGALSNIASGGGRPIDAAWFMKGAGVTDPAQLEAMGVPLSPDSGHGLAGFQLSQLPDDILRAVESGQIKERMGRIIGGSGASEESMRGAYRYLVENNGVTEGRLRNMLEMSRQMTGDAQAAGGGDQIDLLKGTDWDQTFNKQMIAVADLADEVGALLKREKRLFTMADANSAALEAKGSRIDKASAQAVADANARAIDFFQRTWMEVGPIRDLLNEGGTRVANGENKGAVAKQIKNRLVGQLGDLMGEEAVVRADVVQEDLLTQAPQQLDELLPDDRQAMEMLAIQRAIQNGEVRPPETPIPELPIDSGVDLVKVQRDLAENTITDDVVQAMADELDLRAAQKAIDDAMAQEAEKAAREAQGYDLLTFDEKKTTGAVDGFADPPPTPAVVVDIPAGASRKITARTDEGRIEVAAESLMSWTADAGGQPMSIDQARNLVRQKGAILDPDAIPGLDMATAREDKTKGVRNTPATDAVAAAYRQFYGVGGGLRATRQSFGPGAGIPARLVDEWLFEKPDGWAAASVQQLMATKKPAQFTKRESLLVDFAAEVRDRGGEQRFRQAWLDQIEKGVNRNAAAAESVDLDGWLSTYSERTAKSLASSATSELTDAMKEGIRVSGINPERMKVLDQIVTMDQFGPDEAYQATKAWDPVQARLIDQRPYSDAARYIDSRTAGLRVPVQHPSPLQDSILLSLELQLSKTFGRGRSLQRRGRSMVGDAYHEAFHRLQEFLFSSERAALETPQAKEEMVALIKKGNGTYQPDMDIAEIQAEAFAVWALRRYEVRSRGTAVQRIFSAIGEVVNAVGAVARIKLKKNPTVIDIFEDAWGGGIGDRSDRVLQKLGNADLLRAAADVDETLARLRPDIAQRVQAEIDRRYAQVEAALDDWNNRNREGGC